MDLGAAAPADVTGAGFVAARGTAPRFCSRRGRGTEGALLVAEGGACDGATATTVLSSGSGVVTGSTGRAGAAGAGDVAGARVALTRAPSGTEGAGRSSHSQTPAFTTITAPAIHGQRSRRRDGTGVRWTVASVGTPTECRSRSAFFNASRM